MKTAEEFLKKPVRPKRPDLSHSALPLKFITGERIALVGNSTAERMNLFGNFETLLHLRFPKEQLVFRNFARPADEVSNRQRGNDYYKLDDPLSLLARILICASSGSTSRSLVRTGVEKFKLDYEKLIEDYTKKYPRDDAGSPPRFIIVSPLAVEASGDPLMPDAAKQNENLKLYRDAAKAVAEKLKLAFVELFDPTAALFNEQRGLQLTINGCHLNETGDRVIAEVMDKVLFASAHPAGGSSDKLEKLRAAVNDKSWFTCKTIACSMAGMSTAVDELGIRKRFPASTSGFAT